MKNMQKLLVSVLALTITSLHAGEGDIKENRNITITMTAAFKQQLKKAADHVTEIEAEGHEHIKCMTFYIAGHREGSANIVRAISSGEIALTDGNRMLADLQSIHGSFLRERESRAQEIRIRLASAQHWLSHLRLRYALALVPQNQQSNS